MIESVADVYGRYPLFMPSSDLLPPGSSSVRRISTAEQNPAHPIDGPRRAGVAAADIHIDTAFSAKASRPQPDPVLEIAREGDTIVVTPLDRLGRSVLHLVTLDAPTA
ncbi:recombinase family protein [Nocardia higoensis]|uniref:recombinase family protein n=1 Tax=Nocardia higoensis TaxID=228599 RepID=UPI0002E6FDBD|nr:recombinase family protein [Nocardia higoensis]